MRAVRAARLSLCKLCVLASTAVLSAVLVVLVGCGAVGRQTVVIEWSADYFEKYYPRWFEDFEKAHPGVRIKFRAMPSNAAQSIYTMLISDTLSDIVVVGPGSASLLLENDALEPIPDGYLDKEDFMPISLSTPTYDDGTLVAIPSGTGIRPFIYFNTAALGEGKTSTAEIPGDFEPYRAWAAKLFKWNLDGKTVFGPISDDDVERAGLKRRPLGITRNHAFSAYAFFLAYMDPIPDSKGRIGRSLENFLGMPPAHPFRFNDPQFIQGLAEWQKFFVPKPTAIADGDSERINGLQSERYAGVEAGNWIFGEVTSIDMQVSVLPHAPERKPVLSMQVGANGVSRHSKHKDLAMAFARYMADTDQQVDAYYGHGYLSSRFSAWKRLQADADEDVRLREEFLGPFSEGRERYVGQPQIVRTSHDSMELRLFIALSRDSAVARAASWEEQPEAPAPSSDESAVEPGAATEDLGALARELGPVAKKLADAVASRTGQRVAVVVQGTPPVMLPLRSRVGASPIPVYLPLLECGVYLPDRKIWYRLQDEVIARAMQFVSREDAPMSPEEAGKWAQQEAEDIVAGRK